MYKIIASSSSQNSFEIDTHNGQNKSPTLAFVGLTSLGITLGLGLSMLLTWGITAALNEAMGDHNSRMRWGHDFGTIVCVLGATFIHLLNAAKDSAHILQNNDYKPLIRDNVQPYLTTLRDYFLESFSKGETIAVGLKRHGPTAASMAAAGLFSEFQMDHSPEMSVLHVVLVGIIVKGLDIFLGSLARQMTLIRHSQQQIDREIEHV